MASEEIAYVYEGPSEEEIHEKTRAFKKITMDFIEGFHYPPDVHLSICDLELSHVIIRVERRLAYYRVFHGMEANECKEAALYAYWVLRLRPIKIIDEAHINKEGYNDRVNEFFAIHIILSTLVSIGRIKLEDIKGGGKITLGHPFIKKLWYSLRYRNHSANSLIMLAESLTTESFTDLLDVSA